MEKPALRLVEQGARHERPGAPAGAIGALALLLLVAAAMATLRGADRSRRPLDPIATAQEAVDRALARGSGDADVQGALIRVRRDVAREPLDTRTRVVYASMLLALGRELTHTRLAVFHARTAAELSPVTVPVVSTAALVLSRANERADAVSLVRGMFGYDPDGAASLLGALRPSLYVSEIEEALPPAPEAWLRWAQHLRSRNQADDADEWVRRAYSRWPGHPGVLHQMCVLALRRGEPETLAGLFPPSRRLPDEPAAAPALACSALAGALAGDPDRARSDVGRALELGGDDASVLSLAGEVYLALGARDDARRVWNRALYLLADTARAPRIRLLLHLARLEQEYGEPAAALRLWRSVLEIDPDHEEARRGIEELTGVPR